MTEQNGGQNAGKIVTVDGPFGDFLKHADPLAIGHVFSARTLPERWEIEALLARHFCHSCQSCAWRVVTQGTTDLCRSFLARCARCIEPPLFLYSSIVTLYSGDVVVFVRSLPVSEFVTQFNSLVCRECAGALHPSPSIEEVDASPEQVLPFLVRCDTCSRALNFVLWDRPEHYFAYSLEIAAEAKDAPRARLVLTVSALESFLQKAFVLQSRFNQHLVASRRVSFQLKDARQVYKAYFGFDILEGFGDDEWQLLAEAVQARNAIVHNAGLDRQHKRIVLTHEYVEKVVASIRLLVDHVADGLRRRCVL